MKLHITTHRNRASLEIQWHLPGQPHPQSVYLLPEELTPTKYPHVASDCGHLVSFWGDRLIIHEGVGNIGCSANDGHYQTSADVIHVNTQKLLAVLRILHARQVRATDLETSSFTSDGATRIYSVMEIAHHANLREGRDLGRTLKYFRDRLIGGDRTFQDLIRDLSRLINCAWLYAHGDEFYFNGRFAGGCGFNGGIILHKNTYGIHT